VCSSLACKTVHDNSLVLVPSLNARYSTYTTPGTAARYAIKLSDSYTQGSAVTNKRAWLPSTRLRTHGWIRGARVSLAGTGIRTCLTTWDHAVRTD